MFLENIYIFTYLAGSKYNQSMSNLNHYSFTLCKNIQMSVLNLRAKQVLHPILFSDPISYK